MSCKLFPKPLKFLIPLLSISITLSCLSFGGIPPNPIDEYKSPNESLMRDVGYGSDGYIFFDDYFDHNPYWSPDGSQIAFTSSRDGDTDIYIINADGSNLYNVTADPSPLLTAMLYMIKKSKDDWSSWSPDGGKIAFSSAQDNIMMQTVEMNIYSSDVDGYNVINLTDTLEVDGVPRWSPNGNQLVFVSDRDQGTNIFVMDSDGSNVVQLTDKECDNDFPSWSPDGNLIAFESNCNGNYDIYSIKIDGSETEQLTDAPSIERQPFWSPVGNQIAFVSDRDGDNEIYLMDPDGSNITQMTNNEVDDWDPALSPDGRRIAFSSQIEEGQRIFLIDIDGSNLVQLTGGPVESPAAKNSIYYLNYGLFNLYHKIAYGDGSLDKAIEAFNQALNLDEELAEAYLGRGIAYLNRCDFMWLHTFGTDVKVIERNDACQDYNQAISDFETAIELGLAPGVHPGAINLLEKLK